MELFFEVAYKYLVAQKLPAFAHLKLSAEELMVFRELFVWYSFDNKIGILIRCID